MTKALKDYKKGKIAKDYMPVSIKDRKDSVWCADNVIKAYWDKLKAKEK